MKLPKNRYVPVLAACVFLLAAALVEAQAPSAPASAPIPPAIKTAKTIFISNGGADSGLFPSPFSGSADRPYFELYEDLILDSTHQVVSDPSQADLVLEIRLLAPAGPQEPSKQKGASDPLPMLRLVIYDRKTHYVLWALSQSITGAMLQKTHDRNLDDAIRALAADFLALTH
jgi:hypothetical protein